MTTTSPAPGAPRDVRNDAAAAEAVPVAPASTPDLNLRRIASDTVELLLRWILDERRASYGLAVMRIAFGGMTLIILALYLPSFSYSFGEGARWGTSLLTSSIVNDFPWPLPFPFDRSDPDGVLLLKVLVLAVVAAAYTLGWRMRIVSPLFVVLWLGFSTLNPVVTNNGHYQTFRIMLIYLLFADLSRRWSLDARRRGERPPSTPRWLDPRVGWPLPRWVPNLFNNVAVILVAFQLFTVYITSALWKLQGSTWTSGVAAYYPLRLEELTVFPWLNDIVAASTPLVLVVTWLSVYLQLLFPFLLLNRWTRMVGLIGITGMHAGIGVLLALPFFSALMIAADMLFIREATWARVRAVGRRQVDRWRHRGAVDEN